VQPGAYSAGIELESGMPKFSRPAALWLALLSALPAGSTTARAGQRDFDFEIGHWSTQLRRLRHPLSGDSAWVEYQGTTVVSKIWQGRANLVQLVADGPAGHFEGLSLRLYNPQSRQWSLNFAGRSAGKLSQPAIGGFRDGRGAFYDQEMLEGRAICVRFLIFKLTADSYRFEQSYSADGGKSWEFNWVAIDTRLRGDPPP